MATAKATKTAAPKKLTKAEEARAAHNAKHHARKEVYRPEQHDRHLQGRPEDIAQRSQARGEGVGKHLAIRSAPEPPDDKACMEFSRRTVRVGRPVTCRMLWCEATSFSTSGSFRTTGSLATLWCDAEVGGAPFDAAGDR